MLSIVIKVKIKGVFKKKHGGHLKPGSTVGFGERYQKVSKVNLEIMKKTHAHVQTMIKHMSQCMRFPTMWYVRPAKPQISLRIRAV